MAAPPTPPPAPKRWKKWLRRAGLVGGAILLLVIVGLLLLPVWISNDQGRAYILDRLNARLNGPRVSVEKWSLGWFSPTDLTNLKIMEPDGTEIIACPRVVSGLTLWDIWRGSYDVRNTTADGLELRITRRADGTNSLESLMQSAGDILQSARGALQVNDGQLVLTSVRTGQTKRYVDVKATVTIASRQAPFQIQIAAVEQAAAGSPAAGTGTLKLSGTFPPTASLSAASLRYPGIWSLLTDLEFSAMRVPTGLVCDFIGVDAAWAESFGEFFQSVQIVSHPTSARDGSRLAVALEGTGPEKPELDAQVLLQAKPAAAGKAAEVVALSVPVGKDYRIRSTVRWSPPLARLMGRLNPMLGETVAARVPGGVVRAEVASMRVPLDEPGAGEGTGRMTFPPLVFASRDGPSMVRQMQVITGELPASRPPGAGVQGVEGGAGPLRLTLSDGGFSYENFLVTLGKSRLDFSGSVGLDGRLNLTAVIPDSGGAGGAGGLSAGSSRVVVSGTIEIPLVKRPQ